MPKRRRVPGTAVNTAHEQFAAGNHAGALAALERFQPAALVAATLGELRAELREIERRRIEAERQAAERRQARSGCVRPPPGSWKRPPHDSTRRTWTERGR